MEVLKSISDLRQFADQYCVQLPRKGRTSFQREYWTLGNYLMMAARMGKLSFPITFEKSETPDFLLKHDGEAFGLEITEATRPDYQAWLTRIDALDGPQMFSKAGWQGDDVERVAAKLVLEAASAKSIKYRDKFQFEERPSLACYLNYSLPALDEELAFEFANVLVSNARKLGELKGVDHVHVIDTHWVMHNVGEPDAALWRSVTTTVVDGRTFSLMLEPQDEGGLTVLCLELSELVTEGDTMEEAVANANEAIRAILAVQEDHEAR